MRKWLNTYFDLSRREFNGLLVLAALIVLISIVPGLYSLLRPDLEDIPSERQALELLSAQKAGKKHESYDQGSPQVAGRAWKGSELGYFDPNTISVSDWQQLGLSIKQAQSVRKYLDKGGRIKTVEDLQKVYTISPEVYVRIAPYVRITTTGGNGESGLPTEGVRPAGVSSKASVSTKKVMPVIEVNQADSSLLEEIRGIGPAFARRIVAYRSRLGGFYKKEQLKEVYGLDSLKYAEIKDQLRVEPSLLKKIPINTATFEDLRYHPYLRYKQINAIIQFRKQHGAFSSMEDLGRVAILDAQTLSRLEPYLSF